MRLFREEARRDYRVPPRLGAQDPALTLNVGDSLPGVRSLKLDGG
jgi:hypothetical protein